MEAISPTHPPNCSKKVVQICMLSPAYPCRCAPELRPLFHVWPSIRRRAGQFLSFLVLAFAGNLLPKQRAYSAVGAGIAPFDSEMGGEGSEARIALRPPS